MQEYTYLGITITAPGSFSVAQQKTLSDKAMNALFKNLKE